MQFSFVLIDDSAYLESALEQLKEFDDFLCVAACRTKADGLNKIIELKPNLVLMSVNNDAVNSFSILSELHEFLVELPTIIVYSTNTDAALLHFKKEFQVT